MSLQRTTGAKDIFTFTDVFQNQDWNTHYFLNNEYSSNLFKSPIIKYIKSQEIDILNFKNFKEKIDIGFSNFSFQEPNIMNPSQPDAIPERVSFGTQSVKTEARSIFFETENAEKVFTTITEAGAWVQESISRRTVEHYNQSICCMLNSLSLISDISVGDGNAAFSDSLYHSLQEKKGDNLTNVRETIYMNSATFSHINKEAIKNNQVQPFTYKGSNTSVTFSKGSNIVKTFLSDKVNDYCYNGHVPIVLDDRINKGVLHFLQDDAFVLGYKNLPQGDTFEEKTLTGGGMGRSSIGLRLVYVLHPEGFDFIGEKGSTYNISSGLTYEEYNNFEQFRLIEHLKNNKIFTMKVSMGDTSNAK